MIGEFFGDLERLAADLYPYRWPFIIGFLVVVAAIIAFGYRRGWHIWIWRYRLRVGIMGTPVLALIIFVGYDLGSPLFINVTVEEEFPFASTALVPPDMTMAEVEEIMEGMAKVNQEMDEPMPDSMAMTGDEMSDALMPTPTATTEPTQAEPATEPVKLKVGSFRDQDSFHKGSGQATIYHGADGSLVLRLEDFKSTNGPDLHVILSPSQNPKNQAQVKSPGYVDLGKLKGNVGNQNYSIPDEVDISAQGSVVIYCKPFHVIFSVASLQDVS